MGEAAIETLRIKLNELKLEYELAKKSRIQLVENINKLDDKLLLLEEQINAKRNEDNQEPTKNKTKVLLEILRRTSTILPFSLLLTMIINVLIAPTPRITFIQFITNFITIFTFNSIQYSKKNKNRKKICLKSLATLEKEYNEVKQQRILQGQNYKKVREQEVLKEKIFKKAEEVILSQIKDINESTDNPNLKTPIITTRDIYSKLNLDLNYVTETIEHKKEAFDVSLRKYLAGKVSYCYYNAFQPEDILELSTVELIELLLKQIEPEKHKDILENIIHAIIIFSSNLQEYHIVWSEERNKDLINTPKIIYDEEDRWKELKTHQNTDYKFLFKLVYDLCMNDLLTKKDKKKTKQKSN